MSNLTKVTAEYTGGGIYVYQAMYKNKYWVYGGLSHYMSAYGYEPLKYQEENDCADSPEEYIIDTDDMPTWKEVRESLRQPDAKIFGNVEECEEIIDNWQKPDTLVHLD